MAWCARAARVELSARFLPTHCVPGSRSTTATPTLSAASWTRKCIINCSFFIAVLLFVNRQNQRRTYLLTSTPQMLKYSKCFIGCDRVLLVEQELWRDKRYRRSLKKARMHTLCQRSIEHWTSLRPSSRFG